MTTSTDSNAIRILSRLSVYIVEVLIVPQPLLLLRLFVPDCLNPYGSGVHQGERAIREHFHFLMQITDRLTLAVKLHPSTVNQL